MTIWMPNPETKKKQKQIAGRFFAVVPAGVWFGASVNKLGDYALVGCTVVPGFEFKDFEIGQREYLLKQFPRHSKLIQKLTRA